MKKISPIKQQTHFFKATGIRGGAKIVIHKNIPVAAGLAGGSGNCAAVLTAMNMLHGNPLSNDELMHIGASLGADVPYCFDAVHSLQKVSVKF